MGDHGGSQAAQAAIAAKLNAEWAGQGITVLQVADYYDDAAQIQYLQANGETAATIGDHAGILDTSESLRSTRKVWIFRGWPPCRGTQNRPELLAIQRAPQPPAAGLCSKSGSMPPSGKFERP